jgi:hypothetical protein
LNKKSIRSLDTGHVSRRLRKILPSRLPEPAFPFAFLREDLAAFLRVFFFFFMCEFPYA